MPIKGVPTDAARPLADLVAAGDHTVASRCLARQQVSDLTLFSISEGESVSEEEYPTDTAYVCLKGTLVVGTPDGEKCVPAGSCLSVAAHVPHAVAGADGGAVKFLQVNA